MIGNAEERATGIPAGTADETGTVDAGPAQPAVPPRASGRPFDAVVRDRIGRSLRLHYAEVLALPVPDRLRTLLDALAARSDTEAQP